MFQAAYRSPLLHESPFPGHPNQGMGWDTKSSQLFLFRNSTFTTQKKAQVELKSPFFLPNLLPLDSTFLNKVKAKLQLTVWLSLWSLDLEDESPNHSPLWKHRVGNECTQNTEHEHETLHTQKDPDPDVYVWLGYISHENKHRPAGLEPEEMRLVNGKQASGRCVFLGIVIQFSPSICATSG